MVVRAARAALATGVVALVLLGLAGCDASSGPTAATPSTPRSVAGPSATATAAESAFRPTGPTRTAKVVRVVDGDTIVVRLDGRDERLRYIGMDTPETKKQDTPVEWMGPEATAANEALVGGRTVVLEKDVSETDQYDRLLRYVWLRDGDAWTFVNVELVRRGFAQVATFPPDVRWTDLFLAAQRVAREAGVGLWGPTPAPS